MKAGQIQAAFAPARLDLATAAIAPDTACRRQLMSPMIAKQMRTEVAQLSRLKTTLEAG